MSSPAEVANAAVTRDALAAAARLRSEDCCIYAEPPKTSAAADLGHFQPVSVPEPTPSATEPTGGTP